MLLATYITNVQNLLNDPNGQFYSTTNLTLWINQGRTEVAKRTGCIRVLIPSSGSVTGYTMTANGSGYTTATVTVSGPDAITGVYTTATATATVAGGQVTGLTPVLQGSGYVLNPTVTITGNGTGATATATVSPHLTTTVGQEIYTFAAAASIAASAVPGVLAIEGVQSLAVSWGGQKPVLDFFPWGSFQAYLRSYNQGTDYPRAWSQYAFGESGSIYLNPIPGGSYEMQWDCYCTPLALSASQTIDLISDVWTDAVVYYAAHLAYLNAQRRDDANDLFKRFERSVVEAAVYTTPARTPTYYQSEM